MATSCSSLYLWNAGFNFSTNVGSSSEVRALMSLTTSVSSPGGAASTKDEQISDGEDILGRAGLQNDNEVDVAELGLTRGKYLGGISRSCRS